MKNLIIAVVFAILALGHGCGGGSTPCDFNISEFTNGANAAAATSVWNCQTSGVSGSYTFAFYDDGAGYSSGLGAFIWEEVGCREADVQAYDGTSQIRDIEGSIASGIATFSQIHPSGSESTSSCTLQTLTASVFRDMEKSESNASMSLQLNNDCPDGNAAKTLVLVEVNDDQDLWLISNPANNSVVATFYENLAFRMNGAECSLLDDFEIECMIDDCVFTYIR